MNFLPGEIDGDTVKLPIGTMKIPDVGPQPGCSPGPAAVAAA